VEFIILYFIVGVVPTTQYVPPGLVCPPGCKWKSRGMYCYYVDLTSSLTFEDAQLECTNQAGRTARLVIIPDLDTNQFLLETVKDETGSSFSKRLWIGLVRKAEGNIVSNNISSVGAECCVRFEVRWLQRVVLGLWLDCCRGLC